MNTKLILVLIAALATGLVTMECQHAYATGAGLSCGVTVIPASVACTSTPNTALCALTASPGAFCAAGSFQFQTVGGGSDSSASLGFPTTTATGLGYTCSTNLEVNNGVAGLDFWAVICHP